MYLYNSMSKKSIESNGLKTKDWGPVAWKYLHFVSLGYPVRNPSKQKQREYRQFFKFVGKTLPCGLCRDSYEKFIKKHPFTDKVMKTRRSFAYHVFMIHNLVNKKLQCKQLPKSEFAKMYNYYDSYRSKGCKIGAMGCH